MGFPRQEYWTGLPFPTPRDLPEPGIELASPALAVGFLTTEPPGKPCFLVNQSKTPCDTDKHQRVFSLQPLLPVQRSGILDKRKQSRQFWPCSILEIWSQMLPRLFLCCIYEPVALGSCQDWLSDQPADAFWDVSAHKQNFGLFFCTATNASEKPLALQFPCCL